MRAGREIRLVLSPQFRGLIADIPLAVPVPGRKVALLGAAALFVGPGADDDPGIGLLIGVLNIFVEFVIKP